MGMQIIVDMKGDAAQYAVEQLQRGVRAPPTCPQCAKARSLEAHSYYERWVSDQTGKAVRIGVRRFFVESAR